MRSATPGAARTSRKGAFYATDLDAILRHRGIETLIVYGVTTPVVPEPAE
ncbi:MAG TPA: isochorismatase family protein [Polyangiaceae bacterium]|nr:isochorismatase family protein [Polyangiaceae bacterium]